MEKIRINGANTAAETTQNPNNEAEIMKVKAELKAGLAMMEGAAKQIAKIRENLEKEHTSPTREPEENGRDTADISRPGKWTEAGRADSENPDLAWCLEMEAEIWNSFLSWNPVPGVSLSMQLQDLSDMYLALLEAVLKYTMGEAQAAQMERLDSVLSEKLNLLIDTNLKELIALLEETGQTDTLAGIQSSVYKQTTGQSISHREAREFFNRSRFSTTFPSGSFSGVQRSGSRAGSVGRTTSGRSQISASSRTSVSAHSSAKPLTAKSSPFREGMIYQASGGRKIQPNKGFAAQRIQWEGQISHRKEVINNARKGNIQNASAWGARDSFTGRELARANRFVSHLNGSGDLFKHAGITAQNDEVLGLLAAVTSIKGQIYAAETGQKNIVIFPLQSAIAKIIDHYLHQKAACRVYYYTINLYNKIKNPQKAIKGGLEYAYRQFKEKQGDPAFQTQTSYSKQAGFFQAAVNNSNPEKEFYLGLRILEENWAEFLYAVGKSRDSSFLLELEKLSPWGSLMEPARHRTGKNVDIEKFLLIVTAIFIAVTVAYFLLHL